MDGQIGQEDTPTAFVEALTAVFEEVRRVLRPDGTLWLNLGDTYAGSNKGSSSSGGGHGKKQQTNAGSTKLRPSGIPEGLKAKDLVGIPWRAAFALQASGWYFRRDIIWHKPNAFPASVLDRPTCDHEFIFLFSKSLKYFYDYAAAQEPTSSGQTRNRRTVWSIPTQPSGIPHYAMFPEALVEPCLLAGSKVGSLILDPFSGSGTVGRVALKHGRRFVGLELDPKMAKLSHERLLEFERGIVQG